MNLTTFKIDAILARCFDVYRECADNEVLEASKQEYITELVDTPINEPVWQNLKKCKLIQVCQLWYNLIIYAPNVFNFNFSLKHTLYFWYFSRVLQPPNATTRLSWWTNTTIRNASNETKKQSSSHWCLLKICKLRCANHSTGKIGSIFIVIIGENMSRGNMKSKFNDISYIFQSCCWWMCSVSLALPRPRSRRKELHPRLAQLLGYEVEGIRTSIHQEMSWIRSWNWRNSSYVCKWQIKTCSNLVNFHKKVSHMYNLMTDIIQLQTNVLHITYMWKTNF